MDQGLWAPIAMRVLIVGGLAATIYGIRRNATSRAEKQRLLALLFGGWPPDTRCSAAHRILWRSIWPGVGVGGTGAAIIQHKMMFGAQLDHRER